MTEDQDRYLTKKSLSIALDLDERSITRLQSRKHDPLPIYQRGKGARKTLYDIHAVFQWHERETKRKLGITFDGKIVDLETEKARLAKLQADGQELRNQAIRRELLPAKLLELALANVCSQISSHLESIPMKIKKACPHMKSTDLEIIKRVIIKTQNAAAMVELNFEVLDDYFTNTAS